MSLRTTLLNSTALAAMFNNGGTAVIVPARERASKHEIASAYYDQQITYIRNFFASENFVVADAILDVLLDLKKGKIRKNGYTPEHGHEIDQLLPIITSFQTGGLKADRAQIEAAYGTIEKWMIGILVHDLGEDFNLFPEDLIERTHKIIKRKHGALSPEAEALTQRAARSMERLTHYRKFTPQQLETLTGHSTGDFDFSQEPCVPLPDEVGAIIAKKMGLTDEQKQDFQIFALQKKDAVRIIATRYGRHADGDRKFYGADWNSYIKTLLLSGYGQQAEEQDFYDFLVKMGDRNQGMGSRIAVANFTVSDYAQYLDFTGAIFSLQNAPRLATHYYYPGTPLRRAVDSLDGMMGALHHIGRIFIQYHPDSSPNGERVMDITALQQWHKETGINPFHLSQFIPPTDYIYGQTPITSHPLAMMMRELREASHPAMGDKHKTLYALLKAAIVENGDHFNGLFKKHLGAVEGIMPPAAAALTEDPAPHTV